MTFTLYLTHPVLIKIFAAFMRPLPDVAYWILSIPVGAAFVIGLSSEKYRKVFDQVMKRIKSIILTNRRLKNRRGRNITGRPA